MTLQKQKGPAATAIAPDRGSTKSRGGMEMNSTKDSTAAPAAASDDLRDRCWSRLSDLEGKVLRVKNLNEVLFMAGEGLPDSARRNAITTQCDVINDTLREVLDIYGEVSDMMLGRPA